MKKEIKKSPPYFYFLLLLSLALIVIVEAVLIVDSFSVPTKLISLPLIKKVLPKPKEGTISLFLKEEQIVKSGVNLQAQLVFDSPEEPIAGVDVILNFDPGMVSLVSASGNKEVFEQIIINTQQQKQGRVKITAYSPTKTLLGQQTLASLTLRLLKNQPATVGIEFLGPDVITDSNLVSEKTQKDILGKIESLKLVTK